MDGWMTRDWVDKRKKGWEERRKDKRKGKMEGRLEGGN